MITHNMITKEIEHLGVNVCVCYQFKLPLLLLLLLLLLPDDFTLSFVE